LESGYDGDEDHRWRRECGWNLIRRGRRCDEVI
jgi:hypothetical protein